MIPPIGTEGNTGSQFIQDGNPVTISQSDAAILASQKWHYIVMMATPCPAVAEAKTVKHAPNYQVQAVQKADGTYFAGPDLN